MLLEPAHVHGCALLIPAGGFAGRRERRQKKAREEGNRAGTPYPRKVTLLSPHPNSWPSYWCGYICS